MINQQQLQNSHQSIPSRISDIGLTSGNEHSERILDAMLAELSQSNEERWLCWIGDKPLPESLRDNQQFNCQRVLQVISKPDDASLLKRALASGKHHTVAAYIQHELSEHQRQQLEQAALTGDSSCLLIQVRH